MFSSHYFFNFYYNKEYSFIDVYIYISYIRYEINENEKASFTIVCLFSFKHGITSRIWPTSEKILRLRLTPRLRFQPHSPMADFPTSSTSLPQSPTFALSSSTHLLTAKLTHDNYLHWKVKLQPYLIGKNLHGYIDGSQHDLSLFDEISIKPNLAYLA